METIGDESTLSVETANHLVHTGHYQCVAVYWDSSESRFSFTVTVKCKSEYSCMDMTILQIFGTMISCYQI